MGNDIVKSLIAEGDQFVMVGSTKWMNKATGKICDTSKIDVRRFKNGKAKEYCEYNDTAAMFDPDCDWISS